ncbi:MAG: DNA-binding protein Alba [Candidatus Micrarchaeia archaeon]
MIYIGSQQNVMSYVLAVVTQFNAGERSVRLKARGRAMSRAIDVTQIVKHRFFNSLEIKEFKVNTEEVPNEDGTKSRVSSLLLVLAK